MIVPVRCFSCNQVIGHLWNDYQDLLKEYSESPDIPDHQVKDRALSEIGFSNDDYCCRRMFLSHVDIIDKLLEYPNNPGELFMIKEEYDQ